MSDRTSAASLQPGSALFSRISPTPVERRMSWSSCCGCQLKPNTKDIASKSASRPTEYPEVALAPITSERGRPSSVVHANWRTVLHLANRPGARSTNLNSSSGVQHGRRRESLPAGALASLLRPAQQRRAAASVRT